MVFGFSYLQSLKTKRHNTKQTKKKKEDDFLGQGISGKNLKAKFLNILVGTLAWSVGFSSKPRGLAKAGLPNGQLLT